MGLRNPRSNAMAPIPDLFESPPGFAPACSIVLRGQTDLDGFRRAARRLLAQQARPEDLSWHSSDDSVQDLFAGVGATPQASHGGLPADTPPHAPAVTVPAEFVQLCQSVILHSDASRFGLLYRLLWRLQHEPALRHDPLDADRILAGQMAQSVRRDMHKMKAFVRFRTVQDEAFKARPEDGPLHVAWFEPEHHIVQAIAPFFSRRFTQMRWAILTPECSVDWNGASLRFGPGAFRADAPPADAGEELWLTYYQNTFNPARLKLRMMQKEMPRRYWKNLPEAQFISGLAARAAERRSTRIAQPPTVPRRRIPVFRPATMGTEPAQAAAFLDPGMCADAEAQSGQSTPPLLGFR